MKNNIAVLFVVLLTVLACSPKEQNPYPVGKWVSLFNGKDLTGWTPKFAGQELGVNLNNTFRVEDGILKASYDDWNEFTNEYGHLFFKDKFSNYKIRFEYRFVGEQAKGGPGWAYRNNGAMLHCQDPKTMTVEQSFPVSIEAQMLGGNGTDERQTANVCTPGTNFVQEGELITTHCNNSSSKTFHGDQWVTMECEVHGSGVIKHFVNGDLVFEYEQPQYDPNDADAQKLITGDNLLIDEGWISVQAESHPTEFRKIEIMVLEE